MSSAGRPILPPDVNDSADHFPLTKDGIRWGLSDIRQLGPGAVPDIVSRRPYFSLADYLNRVQSDKGGKRQVVENLIRWGPSTTSTRPAPICSGSTTTGRRAR